MHPHPPRSFAPFPPASSHPSLPPLHSDLPPQRSPTPDVPIHAPAGHRRVRSSGTRPSRSRPGPHQLDALKDLYSQTSNPTIEQRTALALEIGLDVVKVTNWFRNLRQTTRKRAQRNIGPFGEEDHDDLNSVYSGYLPSTSVSRDGTPVRYPSQGPTMMQDGYMEDGMAVDQDGHYQSRQFKSEYSHNHQPPQLTHSDDEEQKWEAVTPSPSPPRSPTNTLPFKLGIDPVVYAEIEKESAKYNSGINVEDALLLLTFQKHAFVHPTTF